MSNALSHRRTHNLLLISKLLSPASSPSSQISPSPFTLLLDTLEQPAGPLVREYVRRARTAKSVTTIFLAFETFVKPAGLGATGVFVPCYDVSDGRGGGRWEKIASEVREIVRRGGRGQRYLIIIDSMTTLASLSLDPASNLNLTAFLSSLLQPPSLQTGSSTGEPGPSVSVVAVYHTDIPLPSSGSSSYGPSPLSLLSYLATTLITVHSLAILLSEKIAQAKSLVAPSFGLAGEIEGVMIGLKSKSIASLQSAEKGIVLELEHRRKSGRGVREWFFLPTTSTVSTKPAGVQPFREIVTLLNDHPLFRGQKEDNADVEQELSGMTFDLGLTERQRLEREGVVLPYFDAQKAGGGGEGGRILYDIGAEDDFDEEEDEI